MIREEARESKVEEIHVNVSDLKKFVSHINNREPRDQNLDTKERVTTTEVSEGTTITVEKLLEDDDNEIIAVYESSPTVNRKSKAQSRKARTQTKLNGSCKNIQSTIENDETFQQMMIQDTTALQFHKKSKKESSI